MQIEFLSYIITFIISSGIAVIGISISYQVYQHQQKPLLQILLYQQIFLFSFFIYGIWGNIAIHEIISDLNLTTELSKKLAIFIPVIGVPFLIVSWFMLLKFGFNLNGYQITKGFTYAYFSILVIIILIPAMLIQEGIIKIPDNPDLFVVRILVMLNATIHLFLVIPFLKPKIKSVRKEYGIKNSSVLLYFTGVLVYSAALSFFPVYGFISTCISILLLFVINVVIPAFIKLNMPMLKSNGGINLDFESFCAYFEISKREAEIIQEICSGKTNKAISEKLFITLQTVKDHTHRIYTKTGVKSRVQLSNLVREKTGGGELNL